MTPNSASTPHTEPALDIRPDGAVTRVGRFEVLSTLGWGGMGVVYLARDTRDDSQVALKVLRTDKHATAETVSRFRREISAISNLRHPNIVRIFESGESDGFHWFAMERIEGQTLDRWMRIPELTMRNKVNLVVKVCEAMAHAHDHGIMHRDLKPSNIMVRPDGSPVVTDFGLARDMGSESSLSNSRQALGTPAYMAPEQARGLHHECDHRTDIWGIGVILYEMLVGVTPFVGETPVVIVAAVCENEPPAMRVINASVPVALERIVMCCLRKPQKLRYDHVSLLQQDLQRWLQERSVLAPRYGWRQRSWPKWRPKIVSIALGFLLIIGGIIGTMQWYDSYQQQWGRWLLVREIDFTQEHVEAGELTYYDSQFARAKPWKRGERGLRMDRMEWAYVNQAHVPSDCRVVLTVWSPTGYNAIDVNVNAEIPNARASSVVQTPNAYRGRFGWQGGALDQIHGARSDLTNSVTSKLQAGQVHEISFERDGDLFVQRTDGEITNQAILPMPLMGEGLDRIGFRTGDHDTEILGVKVYRLAPAVHASPLASGDTLVRVGQYSLAVDEYLTISDAYGDTQIGVKALSRALLAAATLFGNDDEKTLEIERALKERTAAPEVRMKAREAYIIRMWVKKQVDPSIQRMHELLREFPHSKVVARCLSIRRTRMTEDDFTRVMGVLRASRDVTVLILDHQPVKDLEAVAHLPLEYVSFGNTLVSDLAPIARPSLRYLSIFKTPVEDLSPLSTCRLRRLDAQYTKVTDLSPLSNQPLEELRIDSTAITDLSPLRGLPIEVLHCNRTNITDLSPLAGAPLQYLRASSTPLSDLSSLRGTPLTVLDIESTQVLDLSPLRRAPLQIARIGSTKVTSLVALEHAPLDYLDISNSPISDFGALIDRPPEIFSLAAKELSAKKFRHLAQRFERAGRKDLARDARVMAACVAEDYRSLQGLAKPYEGRHFLRIPVRVTRQEAAELAERMGASLAVLEDLRTYNHGKRLCGPWPTWIGGETAEGGDVQWINGAAMSGVNSVIHRDRRVWPYFDEGLTKLTENGQRRMDMLVMWPRIQGFDQVE